MDLMSIRRGLMAQMANSSQKKSGFFTGDGTRNVDLNIGFAPDIIIVNCDLDFSTAGWTGIRNVIIVKNMITYHSRHNNATAISAATSVNPDVGGNYPEYGSNEIAYRSYGTYSNGVFTVSCSSNAAPYYFISGQSYSWEAYKY